MKSSRVFVFISLLSLPALSYAQVINEIMYDASGSDTGREWVEVYNNTGNPVDSSSFKFLESPSASNHSLSQVQGVSLIPAEGFAIISNDPTKFLVDFPAFSGNLFKASFSSLNNTGGTVLLKDGSLTTLDQVTYSSSQGASGDGNTLQKTSSGWISALPTPGISNSLLNSAPNEESGSSTDSNTETESSVTSSQTSSVTSAHSSPAPLSSSAEVIEFEISAGRDRLTTVGNRVTFKVSPTKLQNILENGVSYEWSFGDGTVALGSTVSHSYKFAGDYSVVVNGQFMDKEAVSRVKVKVILPSISLAKVLGGLEVANNSNVEINLEGWSFTTTNKNFIFPKDTLISSGKKIVFANEITGMFDDSVEIKNPIGQVFGSVQKSVVDNNENIASSTVPALSLSDIKTKIEDIKNKLVSISEKVNSAGQPSQPILPETVQPELKVSKGVASSSVELANTIEVFTAQKQTDVINKILTLPTRGINFIKRLFTEE